MNSRSAMKLFLMSSFSILLLAGNAVAQSYFVVLREGTTLANYSNQIVEMGAKIHLRVPPQILTFSSETPINPAESGVVKNIFTGPVPVKEMAIYGPVATAAALQWNRSLVNPTGEMRPQSSIGIKSLVAQQSLPAPEKLTLSMDDGDLLVTWDSVPGAALTRIEMSSVYGFSTLLAQSSTDKLRIKIPVPDTAQPLDVFIRARTMDGEMTGVWSSVEKISLPALLRHAENPAPILTSPLNHATSDGFSIVVEWIASAGAHYRLQCAGDDSFKMPLLDEMITGGDQSLPSALLSTGKQIFWRVRRWDSVSSPWSDTRTIVITEPIHMDRDALINPEAPQ